MERGQAYDKLSDLLSEVHHALMSPQDTRERTVHERIDAAADLRFRLWKAITEYRDACVEQRQ
jgi:hypothetical protein